MSSRSMNYLRKHSKVILVVMGIVCMITFVVGSALTSMLGDSQQRADSKGELVVTWTKGKVYGSELNRHRYMHAKVCDFLRGVVVEAIQRGGKPIINGRPVALDARSFDIGIPIDNSEQSAVQTMVLAAEADQMGVAVDNQAVKSFLRQISSPELKEGDWYEIAVGVINKDQGVSVNQLLEHLAVELKAQHVRMLALSGLYAQGVGPIVPPSEAFDLFNRINRRFTIEAYPVETAQFVSQVKGEPTAAEIQKLFDDGKNRDPNPNIDEPGFRKPHKLSFKWLKVNFTPFLDEAKKQISDQQIQEAYDKDVSQGLHKVLELPPASAPSDGAPATGEKKDAEKPAGQEPAGQEPKQDPAADKPTTDKPTDDPTTTEKPAAEKPAETPATDKPTESSDAPQGKEKTDKPAEKSDDACGQEPAAQPSEPEQKAATNKPSDKPSDKPAEEKATDAKPAAAKTEEGKPAENTPAAEQPAEDKPASAADPDKPATTPPASTPPAEPKYKPLADVREEILTRLAQPIAEDARKAAVAEIVATIEKYGKAFRRYHDVKSVRKNTDLKEPEKLDLVPLAAKYSFPIGETPLVDRFEVTSHEIGQKVQQFDLAAAQMGQFRMLSFADIAFGNDEPLFRPQEARSSEPDVSFIYFRTAEEKGGDATLKDAREQVVAFWKKRQAYDLALAEAKKLAEKAAAAGALGSAVPDIAKVITTPPFAWMTAGGFGFGQPEYSTVPGIELAGREFMQGVFSLKPNGTGVAPNEAHKIVYVVRLLSQDPDEERLRTQFLESGYNNMVLMLAQSEALETQYAWYRGVADRYEVKWERPPQEDRRM